MPIDKLLAGLRMAAQALSPDGGPGAAEAIMTTDTKPKQAVATGTGFTVGGMAKGSGMIHPDLATMLAVVTTDYPLAPGEAIEFLRPAVDESFNRDLGRRRLLDERRRASCSRTAPAAIERTPATDLAFAAALREVCGDLARRSSRTARARPSSLEIDVTGAADRRRGEGDRAADRDVAARQDGALRARPELGPRADGGRLGHRTTAASRRSTSTG